MEQCEALLTKMVGMLREKDQPALRRRIEDAVAEHARGRMVQAGSPAEAEAVALRFLQDLDIFVNMRGPDFIYSRGIAESLRVGEDIFELAYVLKHALR